MGAFYKLAPYTYGTKKWHTLFPFPSVEVKSQPSREFSDGFRKAKIFLAVLLEGKSLWMNMLSNTIPADSFWQEENKRWKALKFLFYIYISVRSYTVKIFSSFIFHFQRHFHIRIQGFMLALKQMVRLPSVPDIFTVSRYTV